MDRDVGLRQELSLACRDMVLPGKKSQGMDLHTKNGAMTLCGSGLAWQGLSASEGGGVLAQQTEGPVVPATSGPSGLPSLHIATPHPMISIQGVSQFDGVHATSSFHQKRQIIPGPKRRWFYSTLI
jgi:hypothetical protein